MAKTTLKTVERKTTVTREAISGAFAVVRGVAKPVAKPFGGTVKKSRPAKKKTK